MVRADDEARSLRAADGWVSLASVLATVQRLAADLASPSQPPEEIDAA